ncbi:MAG TPA: hypothetical protein VD788_11750 [Candidatus Polarisedimenticolaceae bacterium]|nr:hypothetical protein [Candidatus Polarisedimenticolaceae bacterium]
MAWIETVGEDEAVGLLARMYEQARRRAGKVFHILRIQSLRPRVLRCSTSLYREVMFSRQSGLTRARRELIATVVSRANDCHY